MAPTDFSAASERAIEHAAKMASLLGATLHIVHVVEDFPLPVSVPGGRVEQPELDYELNSSRKHIQEIMEAHPGMECIPATRIGQPVDAIVEYARAHDISLIVMATSGRTGVARVVLGSVAEGVLRHAPCPVMTLREGYVDEKTRHSTAG
jgi:nucleotide-binding universal stress UspA family protein